MGGTKDKPEFLFPFPSYENWLEAARQELKGADPLEKLTIHQNDLEIFPFYTEINSALIPEPLLKPSDSPYSGARNWYNTPKIFVDDELNANEVALKYLNTGAEGILFEFTKKINPAILLRNISLPDCSISFVVDSRNIDWMDDFRIYTETNFDKSQISGCFFWNNPNESTLSQIQNFSGWSQFYTLGFIAEKRENTVNEIAHCLIKSVSLITECQKLGLADNRILDQISFSVNMGTDFFVEIGKLKSLRLLWHQIKGAYQCSSEKSLHINAFVSLPSMSNLQPHGNMIMSTSVAMAAIAGGCDSLTLEPEDKNNETMCRIARNVSSILREEAHFSKVADPTAGSFYLEALIHQMAKNAWHIFQHSVNS